MTALDAHYFDDMTLVLKDPAFVDADGGPITGRLRVPADRLEPGPRSHRFYVVDLNMTSGKAFPPARPATDKGWKYTDKFWTKKSGDTTATGPTARTVALNHDFHAQNVYGIAARTLSVFEAALGRRVPWGFNSHTLFLVPHALEEGNAFYTRDQQAVLFGYLPGRDRPRLDAIYTCLSHDIVAHEVTHAVLDGLRPRLIGPGLPEQHAFHEALSDIVAVLSVLSVETTIARLLTTQFDNDAPDGRIPKDLVTRESLADGPLMGLAKEFGSAVTATRRESLRRSVTDLERDDAWKQDPAFRLVHRLGEVVVAAVLHTYLDIWVERLRPYQESRFEHLDLDRVAEEGAKAASHLLGMVVRAVDYLPPAELEFEDVVDAILAADETVVPDDSLGYRHKLETEFARFGIRRPEDNMTTNVSTVQSKLRYDRLNHSALALSAEEVYRFIWQNMATLRLNPRFHITVDRVVTSRRTGPYGLGQQEIIADYSQAVDVPATRLGTVGLKRPRVLEAAIANAKQEDKDPIMVQLRGSGVLVFDEFGRLRQHKRKPIDDHDRQQRLLDYLTNNALVDSNGNIGFGLRSAAGMRFAQLHSATQEESW